MSFEKRDDLEDRSRVEAMRAECERVAIRWFPLRYHKRPTAPATAYDIAVGILLGVLLILRFRIQIVHARSYVPSVIALALKRLTRVRYIFDMRGFWADERVEGGLWPDGGRLYRVAKWFERRFLLEADAVISLTHAAVDVIRNFDYLKQHPIRLDVIPTCADLSLFSPGASKTAGGPFILGYVGSVGVWYQFDEVVATFKVLRNLQPGARLLVVNKGGHDQVRETMSRAGLGSDTVDIVAVNHSEMPNWIRRMDAAVFFYKPTFSRAATAPTRFAELLGVGIPILTNVGVGDIAPIVFNAGKPVGVVVNDFSNASISVAVRELIELTRDRDIKVRCREIAERQFSVEWGSERYSMLYRELA